MSTTTQPQIVENATELAGTEYVLGFLFNAAGTHVALIEHAKFNNRLNGIGGHIEPGESPLEAMPREFLEETGALVTGEEWTPVIMMRGPGYTVYCYRAFADRIIDTQKEGLVDWYPVANLNESPIIPNLAWLVPMAKDKEIRGALVFNVK